MTEDVTGSGLARKPTEYEVYDAILAHLYPQGFTMLVLACATVPPDSELTAEYIYRELPSAKTDTVSDFLRVCGQTAELKREFFERAAGIQFTTQPASEAYGLPEIRNDFPEGDGIVYFSRIGFSSDGCQAFGSVDTFSHRSFPNMGFGYYILTSRLGDTWQVIDKTVAWIA